MSRTLPPIPHPERLEVALTVELYDRLSQSEHSYIQPGKLAEGLSIGPGLLMPLARRAMQNNYYTIDNDGDFYITDEGIDAVLSAHLDPASPAAMYLANGLAWAFGPVGAGSEGFDAPPQEADEAWEPLPINREAIAYQEMIAATDAALAEIEQNNGFAVTDPDRRDSIVLAIRGTLNAIKEANPPRHFVVSGLLKPLNFIATSFSGAALGELAKSAVKAVLTWLGSL